ncbi:hypothetical protein LSH36_1140g00096 [Paralvinella palmiformis]|uniref:Uncharacterized protein n=1 Tax=Paralvinella palmiformis TaxID=53620 RepID=A0AAD9IUI0_9ANNE|nr:hypothetical protein LSH36_1140g00096 [Paralvinella palmiformis]
MRLLLLALIVGSACYDVKARKETLDRDHLRKETLDRDHLRKLFRSMLERLHRESNYKDRPYHGVHSYSAYSHQNQYLSTVGYPEPSYDRYSHDDSTRYSASSHIHTPHFRSASYSIYHNSDWSQSPSGSYPSYDNGDWSQSPSGSYPSYDNTTVTYPRVPLPAIHRTTTAAGPKAPAIHRTTTAAGPKAPAIHRTTTAAGRRAPAIHRTTTAAGPRAPAIHRTTTAAGPRAPAIHRTTTAAGPRAPAIHRPARRLVQTPAIHRPAAGRRPRRLSIVRHGAGPDARYPSSGGWSQSPAIHRTTTAAGPRAPAIHRTTTAAGPRAPAIHRPARRLVAESGPGYPSSGSGGWSQNPGPGYPSSGSGGWSQNTGPGYPSSGSGGWSQNTGPGYPSSANGVSYPSHRSISTSLPQYGIDTMPAIQELEPECIADLKRLNALDKVKPKVFKKVVRQAEKFADQMARNLSAFESTFEQQDMLHLVQSNGILLHDFQSLIKNALKKGSCQLALMKLLLDKITSNEDARNLPLRAVQFSLVTTTAYSAVIEEELDGLRKAVEIVEKAIRK